jgi:hypothetical protein
VRRRRGEYSEDLADILAAAGLPGRDPAAVRDRGRREKARRAQQRREHRAVQVPPRRGENRPYGGRAVRANPGPPVWRATTAHLAGLYPWLMGAPPPAVGVYVGYDASTGSAFSCHPIEWLLRGITTNPNVLICGLPGSGKSSHVKIPFGWRLVPFGTRLFVPGDIKGEYPPLCRALGVEPIALGPGLPGRVNPLDAGPLGENLPAAAKDRADRLAEIHRRRLALLVNMAEIRLRRRVSPFEEQVFSHALRTVTGETTAASTLATPTIPQVLALLRDPDDDAVHEHRLRSVEELRTLARDVTSALTSMVDGVLGGLFDTQTTIHPDWAAPIVSLDVSRLDSRGDDVVAAALSCLSTWGQAAIDTADRPVTVVVRDELWRWMTLPGMARKIDSDLRLSRAQGTVQVLATHRLSDFEAVGDAGSEEVAIARGVVASCQTRILLAQDLGPLQAIREEIGLTDTEVSRVASWGAAEVGRALWKVGSYGSYDVQLVLSPTEREITATNERMRV